MLIIINYYEGIYYNKLISCQLISGRFNMYEIVAAAVVVD